MAESIDPILQAAIDRGSALPIGTVQTGHIVDDENECGIGEATANYLQPGTYGNANTTMEESD